MEAKEKKQKEVSKEKEEDKRVTMDEVEGPHTHKCA